MKREQQVLVGQITGLQKELTDVQGKSEQDKQKLEATLREKEAELQTVNREKIRRLRSSTVEPVLGTLVNYLAMRRVNTRGIKQANKCILMSAVAYNLKKLLKWESKRIRVMAQAKMKDIKTVLQGLFFFLFHPQHF